MESKPENHRKRKFSDSSRIRHTARMLTMAVAVCMAWVCIGSGPVRAYGMVRVDLFESSAIGGEEIRLGDVAGIAGEDSALVQRLRQISLGKAPQPGQYRWISPETVSFRLKQSSVDASQVVVNGRKKIRVFRQYTEVAGEQIRGAVEDFFRKNILARFPSARIKEIGKPDSVRLPEGEVGFRVKLLDSGALNRRMPVHVHLSVDGRWMKKILVAVELEMMADVVVASHSMVKGRVVAEGDVILKRMDLAGLPSNAVKEIREVVGKRARRIIPALQVIRTDMVEQPPLVKRGDIVQIIAESDRLRVSTVGMIRGVGGRQNDRVKVVNIESQKTVYARILDARTVRVDYLK